MNCMHIFLVIMTEWTNELTHICLIILSPKICKYSCFIPNNSDLVGKLNRLKWAKDHERTFLTQMSVFPSRFST